MSVVTPDCILPRSAGPDGAWRERRWRRFRLRRPEPPPLLQQRSAKERMGVSALYPPHLHGLTQFSERLAVGGGDSLGKAKNTTPHIRRLHCRGIPRIATSPCVGVVGTSRCAKLPEGFLSAAATAEAGQAAAAAACL